MSKEFNKTTLPRWKNENLCYLAEMLNVDKTAYMYNSIIDRNKLVQILTDLRKDSKITDEMLDEAYDIPDPDPIVGKMIILSNIGGNTPIEIGVNDKQYIFPREREVFVPFEVLEVLNNAVETVLEVIDTGLPTGPERRLRQVRRIPYTVLRDVHRSELEANK